MRRCCSGLAYAVAIIFPLVLTGCLGNSSAGSGNQGVTSVSLSPTSTISIDVGTTQVFTATGKNANGGTVLGVNIRFIVTSANPNSPAPLSIASNGNACAGAWDSTFSICSPGTPGLAIVNAIIEGVSSPNTYVYVHQHIDNIQIVSAETQPPQYQCFSQGQTWSFRGIAYSKNVDITNSVGPMSWTSSNPSVVLPIPMQTGDPTTNPVYTVQTTAKVPGVTQLFATISGTTSTPYPYMTCLVRYIRLQVGGQGTAGNSVTVNNGGSVNVTATAIDSLYNVVDFGGISSPPLTWSTTNPEVAVFSTTTNTTGSNGATARANLGGATLTASCSPPTCNVGVFPGLPIYASNGLLPNGTPGYGAISVDVTSTAKPPTYTAWAATTGCADAVGCSSALFAVNASNSNPLGPITSLPRTPNSMMFNHSSTARVYIGSDQGLMYVDIGTNSPSVTLVSSSSIPCNVSLCGKVLAVSNDGKLAVVADTVSTPGQVYIYNGGSGATAPIDLIFDNQNFPGETAVAAAFSPDQLKLFIFTQFQAPPPAPAGTYMGNMYVYSTVDAFSLVPPTPPNVGTFLAPATDVAFSADGSFAYVAGEPTAGSVSAYSTCPDTTVAPTKFLGSGNASATPLKIYPFQSVPANGPSLVSNGGANDGQPSLAQNIIALEPPNIEILKANYTQQPTKTDIADQIKMTCDLPVVSNPLVSKVASFNLGQGNFVPIFSQLVNDDSEFIVVAQGLPAVFVVNVANGTTSSVPLVNSASPVAATASTDGSQVFVAACDQYAPPNPPNPPVCAVGSIHVVNTCAVGSCNIPPTNGEGDILQVQYINNGNRNMCNNGGNPVPQCLPNMIAIKPQ